MTNLIETYQQIIEQCLAQLYDEAKLYQADKFVLKKLARVQEEVLEICDIINTEKEISNDKYKE